MAKRKPRRARPSAAAGRERSVLTKEQFYLNQHDEEKVLLFTTGIVFGVGIAAVLLDKFVFGGIVALVMALVMVFIETNQKYHD